MRKMKISTFGGIAMALALIGCNRPETIQGGAKNDAWTEKNYSEGRLQRMQLDAERAKADAKAEADRAKAANDAYLADVEDRIKKIRGSNEKWRYSEDIDKMSGKPTRFAFISSENSFNFAFPYAGENYGSLMIRQRTSDGLSIMFSISKGQIICMPSCSISVRFDDKPAMKFNANLPSDYSSNAIFLSPASKFLSELKKSKKLLVEATYHSAGAKVSEFTTEGFKWEGKVAK